MALHSYTILAFLVLCFALQIHAANEATTEERQLSPEEMKLGACDALASKYIRTALSDPFEILAGALSMKYIRSKKLLANMKNYCVNKMNITHAQRILKGVKENNIPSKFIKYVQIDFSPFRSEDFNWTLTENEKLVSGYTEEERLLSEEDYKRLQERDEEGKLSELEASVKEKEDMIVYMKLMACETISYDRAHDLILRINGSQYNKTDMDKILKKVSALTIPDCFNTLDDYNGDNAWAQKSIAKWKKSHAFNPKLVSSWELTQDEERMLKSVRLKAERLEAKKVLREKQKKPAKELGFFTTYRQYIRLALILAAAAIFVYYLYTSCFQKEENKDEKDYSKVQIPNSRSARKNHSKIK